MQALSFPRGSICTTTIEAIMESGPSCQSHCKHGLLRLISIMVICMNPRFFF